MRVLLDGTPFTKRVTGVAAFSLDAVRAICNFLPDWELIIALPKELHPTVGDLPKEKIKFVVSPLVSDKIPNRVWFQLKFPFIVRKYKADIVWSPNKMIPLVKLNKYRSLIIVCDLVWKELQYTTRSSGFIGRLLYFLDAYLFDRTIKNADFIWCISHYTADRLKSYYPALKQNLFFVGGTCNTIFQKKEIAQNRRQEIFSHYEIYKGFVLFVGSLEPRKNLSFLLKLMPEIYKRTGLQLLVVGARGWKYNDIIKLVESPDFVRESVVFADYVDQSLLIELYNIAECYVSTAINEGLGLPQLEAMNCGCPVISPHNSAMIEVVEGRGITIEGWNEKVWIETICSTLSNPSLMNKMRQSDMSSYDWRKIILGLDAYLNDRLL